MDDFLNTWVPTPKHRDVVLLVQHAFQLFGRHLLDDRFRVILGPVRGRRRIGCQDRGRGGGGRQVFFGRHVLLERDRRGQCEHGQEPAVPREPPIHGRSWVYVGTRIDGKKKKYIIK